MKIPAHSLRACLIASCLFGLAGAIHAMPATPLAQPELALKESASIGNDFDGNVLLFVDIDEAHALSALQASTGRSYVRADLEQEKVLTTQHGDQIAASIKQIESRLAQQSGRHDFMKMSVVTPSKQPINVAPMQPSVTGPTKAITTKSVEFEVSAKDPEADQVAYGFDWDCDGVIKEYTHYMASGEKCKVSHVWTTPGDHTFEVYAKDMMNGYSRAKSVTITIVDEKVATVATTLKSGS